MPTLTSFPSGGSAVIIGATGGIGAALAEALDHAQTFTPVTRLSRRGEPALDITDEASIERAAEHLARLPPPRLILDATGLLHGPGISPEKSWRDIDPEAFARSFAVNATGPALLMKHLLPLLPRTGKAVFATLSARVGSIGDNRLGGWYAYRASKAALNQFVHSAAIELKRRAPEAVCVALHPGTVDTPLSGPFSRAGLDVQAPATAAARLLAVIDGLDAGRTGGFFDHRGDVVAW
ncbi:SDR family NAD(P)-dependent oxidoreductase [Microvirga pudoricolor]|uniref:SDR family NAD(P)-dependent oxidoreductase n=1 Tax=Microvirga pudoricolor TaxID=2778729 RepID=UPI001950BC2F|nr:SDR family NAD(P)-dependent oxidoreductase [Microvirga pudoricolor]MBM6596609.1 SDR family NAD(P)-dependent oxidoreductase [Microvirga pudoricolor]